MLREIRPKAYQLFEMSHLAAEYYAFAVWLRATGYSANLIGKHLCRVRNVLEVGNATAEQTWPTDTLERMFECYCRRRSYRRRVDYHAARRAYERYLDALGRLQRREPAHDPFRQLRPTYRKYLEEVRGFCPATTAQHLSTVGDFFAISLRSGEPPTRLSGAHVEKYLSLKSKTCDRHTLEHVVARLRAFLRYAFYRKIVKKRLDTIDRPRTYRGELPPRAMPWALVKKLLNSIDRSSRIGWRNHTMLHLMAYYGLRASEVADLRVDSIDWSAKCCRIKQRKTHCDLVLPLSDRTLNLLRQYLRHGRPDTSQPQLFLRARDPAGRIYHTAVCDVFYKQTRKVGLPPQYSSYSLRHAFAMRLLERGVGVKAIGDCLGHHSLEATCVYLRLSVTALRTVGLPLPRVKHAEGSR